MVFGLQVHGRRVSIESCHGGAQAGRQLWRPLLDRGRKRRRKAGFLVCATKPRRWTAVEDAKLWRHSVGLGTDGGDGHRRRLGPRCGRGGDGRQAASRIVRRPSRERRLGPPTRVSRTLQNRGPELCRCGGIAAKTSSRRKKLRRRSSLYSGLLQTRPVWPQQLGINTPTSPWLVESLESFVFSSFFLLPAPALG